MTAESFADRVRARRSGVGKWMARCPAHEDSNPSLSIAEGADARVLVRCWAGCSLDSIMTALGLSKHDLFAGPPPTLEAITRAKLIRDVRKQWDRQQRAHDRTVRCRIWKLEAVANALGAKLIHNPDDDELGRLFHLALDRLRKAESSLPQMAPELGGLRLETPADVPAWICAALTEIGHDFKPERKTACYEQAA